MKKNYDSMDAYKVCFNASEQVAAEACQVADIGSKYDASKGAGAVILCDTKNGKYGEPDWDGMCQDQSTINGMIKYAQ